MKHRSTLAQTRLQESGPHKRQAIAPSTDLGPWSSRCAPARPRGLQAHTELARPTSTQQDTAYGRKESDATAGEMSFTVCSEDLQVFIQQSLHVHISKQSVVIDLARLPLFHFYFESYPSYITVEQPGAP